MNKIYLVTTNSDLTEGRGRPVVIAYCSTLATAKRLAKKKGVMGSDACVGHYDVLMLDGKPVIPLSLIDIHYATAQDEAEQKRIDDMEATLKRVKEAGLSDADIKVLQSMGGLK